MIFTTNRYNEYVQAICRLTLSKEVIYIESRVYKTNYIHKMKLKAKSVLLKKYPQYASLIKNASDRPRWVFNILIPVNKYGKVLIRK